MRIRAAAAAVSLLAVVAVVATAGCKHGGSAATPTPTAASSQPAEEGTTAYEGSSAAAGGGESSSAQAPTPNPSPMQLDDALLKKWIAYHGELITFIGAERKKSIAIEGKGDVKAIETAAKISDEIDKGSADLMKKYGFTKQQDDEILQAVNDVVGNMSLESPIMAGPIGELKQQAAQPGAGGDAARAQLKQMQDDEKKNLDDMRLKYGPAAVAVLVAHQPELAKQQADALNAALGSGK